MNSTDASVSSTSQPLAEESPKEESPKAAPGADPVEREIDDIDDLLAGVVAGLLRDDPNPESRLKLIAQLNQVSERKHRQSMEKQRLQVEKQRLQLERERFEHQREVKRQDLEMKQQALEIRRQELEIKRQEREARRERAKGKAGFEAPTPTQVPTQAPVHADAKTQAKTASPETATQGREATVRGFEGGTSREAETLRRNVPAPAPEQNALIQGAFIQNAFIQRAFIQRAFRTPMPGDKPALTARGSLEAKAAMEIHGIASPYRLSRSPEMPEGTRLDGSPSRYRVLSQGL